MDEKENMLKIEKDRAVLRLNPAIYPLDIVYAASYVMIDKAFILLDGDPNNHIDVEIRKKSEEQDLKRLVVEFNEELLNYAVYKVQSEKNKRLREVILQRVLLTNTLNRSDNSIKSVDVGYKNDPKGILKPWQPEK